MFASPRVPIHHYILHVPSTLQTNNTLTLNTVGLQWHFDFCPPASHPLSPTPREGIRHRHPRRPLRHLRLLPPRSTIRPTSNPRRQRSPDRIPRLQPTSRSQPLPRMGLDHRLRRHPHHTLRQRSSPAPDERSLHQSGP
jgi:hypothetical protein